MPIAQNALECAKMPLRFFNEKKMGKSFFVWRKSSNFAPENRSLIVFHYVSVGTFLRKRLRTLLRRPKISNKMNIEILNVAKSAKTATFASIVTMTEVKIPKKWGITEKVMCRTEKNGQLNYSYESAVNRHRIAEGKEADFEAEPLPWGKWFEPNLVIEHKEKFYLRFYDIKDGVISKTYYVGGRIATDAELGIINAWKASQSHSSRQGVEKEVKPTAICFDNIKYLACGGVKFGAKD